MGAKFTVILADVALASNLTKKGDDRMSLESSKQVFVMATNKYTKKNCTIHGASYTNYKGSLLVGKRGKLSADSDKFK